MAAMTQNLFGEPPPTLLPDDEPARPALEGGADPADAAAAPPSYAAAWAALADRALAANDPVAAYAYARTGYHRSLDQLRRAGWKGHGPVPWEHEPNRGFLRALAALARAAAEIGEDPQARRARGIRDQSHPTMARPV